MRMNSRGATPFHCILVADASGSNRLCPCRRWWGPRADPPAVLRICLVPSTLPLADQSQAGQWVPRDGAEMRQLRPCGSAVYLHATRTPSVGLRKSKSPRPSPAVSFPSTAGTMGSPPVLPAPHASHSRQARAEICSLSTAGTPFPFPFPFPG